MHDIVVMGRAQPLKYDLQIIIEKITNLLIVHVCLQCSFSLFCALLCCICIMLVKLSFIFSLTILAEGYAPVAELLPLLSYCEATENDVREIVENIKENHFTLKEGPPLQIKANYGHKLKEVCTISIKSYGMLSID